MSLLYGPMGLVTILRKKSGGVGCGGGPGSNELLAGDCVAGFFGEVTTAEFGADHADLYTLIGLTAGTLQNQTEPFLKFIHDGKIKFIPKKSTRNNVSWDHVNIALGGSANGAPAEKTITVGNFQYKVRFMRGAGRAKLASGRIATADYAHTDRASIWSSTDNGATGNWSSQSENEWSTLILPLHISSDDGGANKNNFTYSAYAPDYVPDWASYTDAGLNILNNGGYVWCAETRDNSTAHRIYRGGNAVAYIDSGSSSGAAAGYGCRLVFEFVI